MSNEKWMERHEAEDKERFDKIDAKLDALIAAQNKQKGFIAGFSAAFSLLVTTVVGLIVYIWLKQYGPCGPPSPS